MSDAGRIEPYERLNERVAESLSRERFDVRPCIGRGCMTLIPSGSASVLCRFCVRSSRERGGFLAMFSPIGERSRWRIALGYEVA